MPAGNKQKIRKIDRVRASSGAARADSPCRSYPLLRRPVMFSTARWEWIDLGVSN